MSFQELNLVDLRPSDDRQAGKLAASLRGVDFSNKRSVKLHSSGMSFGGITVGDVVTDKCDAETTSKRVGLALPQTGSITYRSRNTEYEAKGTVTSTVTG